MNIYQKIYIENFGKIPEGYDIHHIDGNHANNHPQNLKAVTLQEHYDIHKSQCDFGACYMLSKRLKLSPKIISNYAEKENLRRVKNGTHNFLGSENNKSRLKKGTHPSQNSHCLKKMKKAVLKQVVNKTHPFLGSDMNSKTIKNGTHSSTKTYTCPHCKKSGKGGGMKTFHFEKCKFYSGKNEVFDPAPTSIEPIATNVS